MLPRFQTQNALVFLADDEESNIRMLSHFLQSSGYRVVHALNGCDASASILREKPDVILLDISMPCIDGITLLQKIKNDTETCRIPVLMITGNDDRDIRLKAIESGAADFIQKPVDLAELGLRLRNTLELKSYQDILIQDNERLSVKVSESMISLYNKNIELKKTIADLSRSYRETILRLNLAAEFKDEETASHVRRIGLFAAELASLAGMDSAFNYNISYAATMHDIGKVGIPDSILRKEGPLDPSEWSAMKEHTLIGSRILGSSDSDLLNMAEKIALTHHERWSGSGYPNGLKKDLIPVEGRITHLIDQYDALRSRRPYKGPIPHGQVMKIMSEGDGRTSPDDFDPDLLQIFMKHSEVFNNIYHENQ